MARQTLTNYKFQCGPRGASLRTKKITWPPCPFNSSCEVSNTGVDCSDFGDVHICLFKTELESPISFQILNKLLLYAGHCWSLMELNWWSRGERIYVLLLRPISSTICYSPYWKLDWQINVFTLGKALIFPMFYTASLGFLDLWWA